LNAAARLICPHGGQVQVAPRQVDVLVGGLPALREGDLVGAPITGCQVKVTAFTNPCTAIVAELPIPGVALSLTAMAQGRPLLLQGVRALTNSRPPGTAVVAFPGQTNVMAT
jgi:hypothetical protein